MLKDDFVIQTNVRRMLIRSNIDFSQLTFGTVRGVVYIQGNFKLTGLFPGENIKETEEIVARTIRSLELKIKSISGVIDVKFQLFNWKKEKGQWLPTKVTE